MPERATERCLLLFTKPARPGRVKTRLIGELSAEEAARLHQAFVGDLLARLAAGEFRLRVAWDLEDGERIPEPPVAGLEALRQEGADLGERLHRALSGAAEEHRFVAALGSDHPHLPVRRVEDAFARLEAGADLVLGPAEDGGYYLVAARAEALSYKLFEDIPWSTEQVFDATLERCQALGVEPALLPPGWDVDRPEDLARLGRAMAEDDLGCPRTRALLASWDRLTGHGEEAS